MYLPTLEAWLSAFGDIGAASASLHVHPNTFRYRLGKLRSLQLFDLDDADTRFRLMVHLRIRHLQ
ncbi:helix-turn-helix domain-containing protein [Rhodococcus sp. no. 34]